jgi:hypothetical protein
LINKICYISKKCKNDNSIKIIKLQKYIKNLLNKKNEKTDKVYNRLMILNSFITKEFKDNSLDKNKIKLIQNLFRKYLNNKDKENILDKYKKNITKNQKIIITDNNNIKNGHNKNSDSSSSYNSNKIINGHISSNCKTNDKTRNSYSIIEKNDKIVKNRNLINTYENNNYYKDSYNNDEKEENENNDLNNAIKVAYQINIYKNKDEDIQNKEEKLTKLFCIKQIINKLRKKTYQSKQNEFLKMLIQRINKNINQYVFQKIQIYNYKNKQSQSSKINENVDSGDSDYNNMPLSNLSNNEPEKKNFFFNTIRRHLAINKKDNNWEGNNEIINLLRNNIPKYFRNYPQKNYIPYINKKQEKNLVNSQMFLFDDDKLADYIYKCYKTEKNSITITTFIIKSRLIKDPLKNQNLFTITRYMDNLYNDIINGNICQNCCCKNNELCLVGCKCHKNKNSLVKENIINIKNDNNTKKNKKTKDKEIIKFQVLKRFIESEESSEFNDSNIMPITVNINNRINNSIKKKGFINNENLDKNSYKSNKEQGNKYPNKPKNYIRDYILRKKNRSSLKSNGSNLSNKSSNNENDELQIINYDYSYNNNLNEKNIPKNNFDYEQCNIYDEEDNKYFDEENDKIKKINSSLFKKQISPIIPISNPNQMIIKKINSFRYEQDQARKKNKEIIKLRDTNINYDNEIYENI